MYTGLSYNLFQSREDESGMEEMEEMTALSLGIGISGEHSKSRRGRGCKPKPPVQFHDLLPGHQQQGETGPEGNDNIVGHARKKLRLCEDQLTLLEIVYEEQSILDPAHKQELAKKMGIKLRQVEVWFQNRRARSKQKNTEADCEILKRRAEVLAKENQELKRKLILTSDSQPDLILLDSTHSGSSLGATCSTCNKVFVDWQNHMKQ